MLILCVFQLVSILIHTNMFCFLSFYPHVNCSYILIIFFTCIFCRCVCLFIIRTLIKLIINLDEKVKKQLKNEMCEKITSTNDKSKIK